MSRPRVAVIGSCVSRDNFNSKFSPNYKNKVDLVADVYQSSLPSLARAESVYIHDTELVEPYNKVLNEEYSGKNLEKITNSRPDIVVMDGYADIQFGVTKKDDLHITRNHMAFASQEESDQFYDDKNPAEYSRARFGEVTWYEDLAVSSLHKIFEKIQSRNKQVTFVLNPARFALKYHSSDGLRYYPGADRLAAKNECWTSLDKIVSDLGAVSLSYDDINITGSKDHAWGLNPVHYQQDFYDEFWKQFEQIIS